MEKRVIEQLDLNAEIMALVRERLEAWKESHKEYDEEGNLHMKRGYDEVCCDVKELKTDIVLEVYDYLRQCNSGALLVKTGLITGISRRSVSDQLKK